MQNIMYMMGNARDMGTGWVPARTYMMGNVRDLGTYMIGNARDLCIGWGTPGTWAQDGERQGPVHRMGTCLYLHEREHQGPGQWHMMGNTRDLGRGRVPAQSNFRPVEFYIPSETLNNYLHLTLI